MTEHGGVSRELDAFVREAPIERRAILAFMRRAAESLPPGARVLDAGAGEAPYRELFSRQAYVTCDWGNSPHPGAHRADMIAPLDRLPAAAEEFDAVLSTQVLEHVANPGAVLGELNRVLVPGGRLWLTVPFVGELHEEPFDYYRYTPYALSHLLEETGFSDIDVQPIGGYFSAMAQLARNCGPAIGVGTQRSDATSRAAAALGRLVGRLLPALDRMDRRRALPVGWCCTACRDDVA